MHAKSKEMKKNNRLEAMGRMRRFIPFCLLSFLPFNAGAQQLLTLDSCRAMALRNNKQMSISRVKQDIAANLRKSARTKYLPRVSALGGYEWTSKEISLLSDDQKTTLSNLGANISNSISTQAGQALGQLPQGAWQVLSALGITPEVLQQHQLLTGS